MRKRLSANAEGVSLPIYSDGPRPNLPDDGVRVTLDNDDNNVNDPTEIPNNTTTEDETQDTNTNNNDKNSEKVG